MAAEQVERKAKKRHDREHDLQAAIQREVRRLENLPAHAAPDPSNLPGESPDSSEGGEG